MSIKFEIGGLKLLGEGKVEILGRVTGDTFSIGQKFTNLTYQRVEIRGEEIIEYPESTESRSIDIKVLEIEFWRRNVETAEPAHTYGLICSGDDFHQLALQWTMEG